MPTPERPAGEFADLDRLIVRSLAALRLARAACRAAATPRNVAMQDRAEDTLNALLDSRAAAGKRAANRAAERLPA